MADCSSSLSLLTPLLVSASCTTLKNNISLFCLFLLPFHSVPQTAAHRPDLSHFSFSLLICSPLGLLHSPQRPKYLQRKGREHTNVQSTPHSIHNAISWKSRAGERREGARQKEREKGRGGWGNITVKPSEDAQTISHTSTLVKQGYTSSQSPVGAGSINFLSPWYKAGVKPGKRGRKKQGDRPRD